MYDLIKASHNGFERLQHPVIHTRSIRYDKKKNSWSLSDELTGSGSHTLTWHFHFDVGIDLGSPVSLDYYDRVPFRFNGKIERVNIQYVQ